MIIGKNYSARSPSRQNLGTDSKLTVPGQAIGSQEVLETPVLDPLLRPAKIRPSGNAKFN
jgi:hypothetical protein